MIIFVTVNERRKKDTGYHVSHVMEEGMSTF